jgi:hypothetical protein
MKRLLQIFTITLLLFNNVTSSYGQVTFSKLNGPTGISQPNNIVSDNNGRLFMISRGQYANSTSINVSPDNGNTWTERMLGLPPIVYDYQKLSFLVGQPGDVFVSLQDKIYKYNTNNNTWVLKSSNELYSYFAINSSSEIWKLSENSNSFIPGMDLSIDGGVTFTRLAMNVPTNISECSITAFNDSHNLLKIFPFGTGPENLYHFNKNGDVQLVFSGYYLDCVYNPYTGTAFLNTDLGPSRSTDGGLTWSVVQVDNDPNGGFIKPYKFLFGNNGETWACYYQGLYLSMDEGLTWTKVAPRSTNDDFLINSDTWFTGQLFRSTDNRETWEDVTISSLRKPTVREIIVDKTGNLYAYTTKKDCFDVSYDNGQTWDNYLIPTDLSTTVSKLYIEGDKRLAFGSDSKLYRSLDDGGTWTLLQIPSQGSIYGVHIDKQGNFYYNGATTHKSTDLGVTWKNLGFSGFQFCPNGDILYLYHQYSSYYSAALDSVIQFNVSPDAPLSLYIISGYCTPSGTKYIHAKNYTPNVTGFYRVTDFDAPWELLPPPANSNYSYNQKTPNSVGHYFAIRLDYAQGQALVDVIVRSLDDGLTWTPYANLPKNGPSLLYCDSEGYLYISYPDDVIYRRNTSTVEAKNILGTSWIDINNDCLKNSNENVRPYTIVQANGNSNYLGFVDQTGNYKINLPVGAYQVSAVAPNPLYESCPSTNVTLISSTPDTMIAAPLRVVATCPYLNLSMSTPFLRRCFENTYTIQYKNEGTAAAQNAYIEVTLDSLLEFIGASLPVFAQNGNIYTFQVGNVGAGQFGTLWIKFKVSCTAELGQIHCFSAKILPEISCSVPLVKRNESKECRQNIGAFDPNEKTAFVDGIENPEIINQNKEIEYVIQFQNTGTDTAFKVVIKDRMSNLLDLSTFTPLVSSHPFTVELNKDQHTISFIFDNIMLPDSNINQLASNGFVKFRISEMPSVSIGSVIRNYADIYFDFNAAIKTNEVKMTVGVPPNTNTNTYTPSPNYQILAYPNPFNDQISFEISTKQPLNSRMTLSIVDVLGKQILREKFIGTSHNVVVSDLQTGIYFYKIENGGGVIGAGKLMKM